jgi:hypothetical protein
VYIAFNRGPAPLLENDEAQSIALQPDGKILVAGRAQTGADTHVFAVARLSPAGDPDLDFGVFGQSWSSYAPALGTDNASAIAVGNGGIMIAGFSLQAGAPNARFGVARLQLPPLELFVDGFE